jgi:hypothetical protein
MTRSILLAGAALISVGISSLNSEASEAPWCAVITIGEDAVYWDCRYRSFAECRTCWQAIVAFAIRARTTPPTLQNPGAQRNAALARSSSATDISINVRFWPKAGIPSCTPCPLSGVADMTFS